MALTGKRILITGGAGFIGTTLARRLVDENEIVAFDNLHRDALGGTDLADHPNFTFVQGDVLDAEAVTERRARGDPHRPRGRDRRGRHRAREPGADDAREPDRHLQRARGRARDEGDGRAAGRVLDQRGLRHATPSASTRPARRPRAPSARRAGRTRSRSSPASTWRTPTTQEFGLPTVSVRPFNVYGPGQIGGGAIRAFIEAALAGRDLVDPRRRLADPRVVLRGRHGRGPAARTRAPERGRRELQHRQRALGGDDLRPRAADQARSRAARARSCSSRSTTLDVELRIPNVDKARDAARLRGEGRARRGPREDDRVVPGEDAVIRLAWPDIGERGARRGRGGARERDADDGREGRRARGQGWRAPARSSTRSRSRPGRRRSTSRCWRSGSGPATR